MWDLLPPKSLASVPFAAAPGSIATRHLDDLVGAARRAVPSRGVNSVYRSVDAAGNVQYVGITNNMARRAAAHLREKGIHIEELLGNLSRSDARAVEQALIEIHHLGKHGETLINKINSIAPTNPAYADLLKRGLDLLKSIGY
ncbi:MAG: hypothetical protein GYA36_20385 [Veillonellaceae bacterium]|nr:hypothetical protein [Veillonellaceae bacterium]